MKKLLFLVLSFIVIICSSYLINETIRRETGEIYGFTAKYQKGLGRYMFRNEELYSKIGEFINSCRILPDTTNSLKTNPEYLKLRSEIDFKLAMTDGSGKIFTFFSSLIAILIYFARRKKKIPFSNIDWILIICSLIIVKEGVWESLTVLFGGKLCDEICFWEILGLNWYYASYTVFALVVIWLAIVILKIVPKGSKLIFFISGFFGSIISFFLLLWYIAPYLL